MPEQPASNDTNWDYGDSDSADQSADTTESPPTEQQSALH